MGPSKRDGSTARRNVRTTVQSDRLRPRHLRLDSRPESESAVTCYPGGLCAASSATGFTAGKASAATTPRRWVATCRRGPNLHARTEVEQRVRRRCCRSRLGPGTVSERPEFSRLCDAVPSFHSRLGPGTVSEPVKIMDAVIRSLGFQSRLGPGTVSERKDDAPRSTSAIASVSIPSWSGHRLRAGRRALPRPEAVQFQSRLGPGTVSERRATE